MPFSMIQPLSQFVYIGWMDIIDVLIVAFLVYKGISLVRETRAQQLLKGIVILIVLTQLSEWFQLNTISFILRNAMQFGMLALIIVFQPELRRALEKMGRSNIGSIFKPEDKTAGYSLEDVVSAVTIAAGDLSLSKTGALIVIERETKIGEIVGTGTVVDARVSPQILENIFFPNSPLHDGAVIMRQDRILAAGCYLPLTDDNSLSKQLGTRHRAAIGISETADCAVVVVSEETGKISLALGGDLTRNLTPDSLGKWLIKLLTPKKPPEQPGKFIIRKVKNKWQKGG